MVPKLKKKTKKHLDLEDREDLVAKTRHSRRACPGSPDRTKGGWPWRVPRCPCLVFVPQAASSSFTSLTSWIFAALRRELDKAEQILRRFARPQASHLPWNHNWRKSLRSQAQRKRDLSTVTQGSRKAESQP